MNNSTKSNINFERVLRLLGKGWVIVTSVIGSLVVVLTILFIMLISGSGSPTAQTQFDQKVTKEGGPDKIAVIKIEGEITDQTDASFSPVSSNANDTLKIIETIKDDESVKGVVVKINSPGGAVVPSDDLYKALKSLRDHKPVVASLGDLAASGGYYIASGTNKIFANPATITGSIGVIMELPKLQGLYEKLGVEMRTIQSGKFKDIGSASRDLSPEEVQIFNSLIQDAYNQFTGAVAEGRNLDINKVKELSDGRIYSGLQAKDNGLVDSLGNFEDALKATVELAQISNPTVVEYNKGGFLTSLLESSNRNLHFLNLIPTTFNSSPRLLYLFSY